MARHWVHRKMYSRKSERYMGSFYRNIVGVPIDSMGYAYCPRCDSGENNQIEEHSQIQHDLSLVYGTLFAYMRCYECGLRYNFVQEEVLA